MDLFKIYAEIAYTTAQRLFTVMFVLFTLTFAYSDLTGRGGWVVAGTFLTANGLFWWAGSGLHSAFLGGQRIGGIFFATLFCGFAYWLIGTLPSNHSALFMSSLSWGVCGFILGWLSTSKRHIEVVV